MWPDSDQTQELLQHAGRGDAAAVHQLLDRHRDSLRQMVQFRLDRALAGRIDASDIVQDVLLEAHQRLADYINVLLGHPPLRLQSPPRVSALSITADLSPSS